LPSQEDINPNLRFANNSLLLSINKNAELKAQLEKRKISWQNDFDVVRKLFTEIRNGDAYKEYLAAGQTGPESERDLIIAVITDHLSENEVLISLFEE